MSMNTPNFDLPISVADGREGCCLGKPDEAEGKSQRAEVCLESLTCRLCGSCILSKYLSAD